MPWDKKTVGDKICVYKKTTGKVLHCYSGDNAEEDANKYLAALHANAPEGEKEFKEEDYCLVYPDAAGDLIELKEDPVVLDIIIQHDTVQLKGGSGSGNFGHSGRPGEVGGSSGSGGVGGTETRSTGASKRIVFAGGPKHEVPSSQDASKARAAGFKKYGVGTFIKKARGYIFEVGKNSGFNKMTVHVWSADRLRHDAVDVKDWDGAINVADSYVPTWDK